MPLTSIEYWTESHCPYERSFVTQYLVLLYYTHYFISLGIFLEGLLRTRELYLLLLSFGIAVNFFLNYFLLWLFSAPVPFAQCGEYAFWCIDPTSPYNACGVAPFPVPSPPGATCGAPPLLPPCSPCVPCGMPALEPQLTAFTVTSIGVFAMQWMTPHIYLYQNALIVSLYALVGYAHAFFSYNSPEQIMVGMTVGSAFALLWQLFIFWFAYPNFDRALRWPLVRRFGYVDTFCRSYRPVPGDPKPMGIDADDAAAMAALDEREYESIRGSMALA